MTLRDESIELLDRLVAEYADRLARDEDPRREEFLAQAPHLRNELERLFRMLEGGAVPGRGTLTSGTELGGYRLVRELGRGGMAVVYEAEEIRLRRRVALKVLRHHLTLDGRALERFQREARAAAKLAHEHVVPIHAVGTADGHAFIAFELVRGPTLAAVIAALQGGAARPTVSDLARATGNEGLRAAGNYAEACARLIGGVLEAMAFAHSQGVIHRDLKPSNVLLTSAGKPLVADFGLAKDLGEASLSLTGETLGTPHYMAPEQASSLSHRIDERTDVYALGVLLYELLTLRRPFEGHSLHELVQSIVNAPPRPPCELAPDVPAALGDIVLQAMAKEPGARYASVEALRADLERALRGETVVAQPSQGLAALMGRWFEARARHAPFEYRSKATLLGLPWIHVVSAVRDPLTQRTRWAKGVIAMGDLALGVYAGGTVAIGLVAVGVVALGPVALGLLALGQSALGAMAVGWRARGLWVAGHEGRGLLDEWVANPALGALISFVGIVLSMTLVRGIWSRAWPGDAERARLRRITCLWMPLAFLLPLALELGGLALPFVAHFMLTAGITLAFGMYVKAKLGSSRLPTR
jgi:tRNA A-37 threonylcarbamoyl transferase component Bud32